MVKRRIVAVLLAFVMAAFFTSCANNQGQQVSQTAQDTTTTASTQETTTAAATTTAAETTTAPADTTTAAAATETADASATRPLVIATGDMNGKFSPFTAESTYDSDIVNRVLGDPMIVVDRLGELVYNGIEGETRSYNGSDYFYNSMADGTVTQDTASNTTTYDLKLRQGVKFSDGVAMNIDDVIFTLYAFVDPSYTGSSTLYTVPIHGLKEYRQGYQDAANTYSDAFEAIRAAGPDGDTSGDSYTADMFKNFWDGYNKNYQDSLQAIIDECVADYSDSLTDIAPNATDLATNTGLQIALGMYAWGFADKADAGGITDAAGKSYNLTDTYPAMDDFTAAVNAKYDTGYKGASEGGEFDGVSGATAYADFVAGLVNDMVAANPDAVKRSVTNISGIKRINDYEVQIVVDGYDASAVFKLFYDWVVPLHYYGDTSKYDFANDKFGFDYGDTSFFSKTETSPMGAGPYKFVKYENKTVYLEANDNYWKGAPLIKQIQYKVVSDADTLPSMQTGTVDIANVGMNTTRADQIKQINNGDLTGDVITYTGVKNLGYGYIGINTKNVSVNGERGSDASKDLRKGIATILAVYRDMSVSSYYGDLAEVINYPMSETSWAAPQRTDPGYAVAYSKDADGKDIYTSSMTDDDKYAAAQQAALGFFQAAGYTVDGGKVTAAPAGAKTTFEVQIIAGGTGDHPSFLLLTKAKEALANIGITLNIRDLPNESGGDMWDAIDAETVDMWCAAWQATPDPDIYQLYDSDGMIGSGTGSNYYGIDDKNLDDLIMQTRTNPDNDQRKALFLQAFNIILDWGVEVPIYQRDNSIVFSTPRIDISTLPGDMTTYYDYTYGIEKIALK